MSSTADDEQAEGSRRRSAEIAKRKNAENAEQKKAKAAGSTTMENLTQRNNSADGVHQSTNLCRTEKDVDPIRDSQMLSHRSRSMPGAFAGLLGDVRRTSLRPSSIVQRSALYSLLGDPNHESKCTHQQ